MREKYIEQKLVKKIRAAGGIALKFLSPSFDGMPDRIVLFPKGKIIFVEVKRSGVSPSKLQISRHGMLRSLGFKVYVLDDDKKIKEIIDGI